ncbi:cytochrome P450 2U1-like [Dermacentor andersoni]|uniref:cytochrome P450 2U1-like n=1 Tax=Dermacentor andersoni TaxID=34620 RepID=UPI0024176D58|nr:cytochrome P450 2C31-like [Dermacentor andersoni]
MPPTPPASSIRGHVEVLRHDFYRKKALEWAKVYGPVIRLKVNFMNVVILNDFDSIKKFCNTKELLWRSSTLVGYEDRHKGVGSLNGEAWSANRKFCLSTLRDVGFAKTAMEDRMMEEFGRVADSIGETGGRPLNVNDYVMPCAFNNIVSFFYGRQLTHDHPTRRELYRVMKRVSLVMHSGPAHQFLPWKLRKLLSHLPFTRNHRVAESMAQLRAISEKQVGEFQAVKDGDECKDFIHRYIKKIEEGTGEANSFFTDCYLVGNVNSFLMAGTFSPTNTMTWQMLNFARNADTVQARVQREIDDVVGHDRQPTWEDRKQMPYTLACVWEAGRWKTASPLGLPRECAEDVVVGDFFLPKGTVVLPNIWAVHNDPTLWKEPTKFDPGRYLNEDGTLLSHKPEHLIPFCIGPRACPGGTFATMEIFLLVTFLLQKYRVVPEKPIDCDLDSQEIDLSHVSHIKLRFLRRNTSNS